MANTGQRKKRMLECLENRLGIVSTAARDAGIDRATHYRWMQSDPDYKRAVEALDDVALDFAEECLFKQMREGTPASTIFYLKYRARKRGYVERKEITGEDGGPIKVATVDPAKLSTEAIREYLQAAESESDDK